MTISPLGSFQAGVSIEHINRTVNQGVRMQEGRLRDTLSRIGKADGSVTQMDLLRMQQEVQQWTMLIDIQSTITKQLGDSIKSVIQKAG